MKIIYYSHGFFTDCDFPLIRELQSRGLDVEYYMPVASFSLKSSLLDLDKLYPKTGIFPASVYPAFQTYKDEIDLSKVYVVNQVHKQKWHPINLLLYARLALRMIRKNPDIIHVTLPPTLMMNLLYMVKKKLVLTLHDPFTHSGRGDKRTERDRLRAFHNIKKIILLNQNQVDEFVGNYNVPREHVFVTKLGMYDSITRVQPVSYNTDRPYILFFGLIAEYKGLEYLMQAMVKIHEQHPDVKLVVAGGGKLYFDMAPFKNMDYIDVHNHYVGVPELAGLLKGCMFSVCPYKDATQSGVVQTAFSLSVPMIVTNVGALPEAVHDGMTGLVVPPCDVDALAEAMNILISNPDTLATMRENIENKWKKDMNWSPIADKYIECYHS